MNSAKARKPVPACPKMKTNQEKINSPDKSKMVKSVVSSQKSLGNHASMEYIIFKNLNN